MSFSRYPLVAMLLALTLGGCATSGTTSGTPAPGRVDVALVSDEARAAAAILARRLLGATPTPAELNEVFVTEGYEHLKEREAGMGRAFTDSSFAAFLLSDSLLQRAGALISTLPGLERVDVSSAAAQALTYLPASARIHARLYLEIKPRTNSFVFTGRDSVPSIFLYVRPNESPAQLQNTLTHELHHIGLRACPDRAFQRATPAERMVLVYLGAFGEGQAMLAAAGSASTHPHAADDDTIRTRWDRDVANAPADIEELTQFFTQVLDNRITSADSVQARAATYFGTQGPWYTVGWVMASTVERELGRAALIETMCDPMAFITRYQTAAARANARGASAPLWDAGVIARLETLWRNSV